MAINTAKQLHIVNGDSVGEKLIGKLAEGSDILVWREILTFGPVFEQLSDSSNGMHPRASFLHSTLGIPVNLYIDNVTAQHAALRKTDSYDEVILWFEYDLFDVTILMYLLHWFYDNKLPSSKLQLLWIGTFPGKPNFKGLGELSSEQLLSLIDTWHEVSEEELRLGSEAWKAYTSSDPMKVQHLLDTNTNALPLLHAAWSAHLQRFPSVDTNLNRIEAEIVQVIRDHHKLNPVQLFQTVTDRLSIYGMGDLEFWQVLRAMEERLVSIDRKGAGGGFPDFQTPAPANFREWSITLRMEEASSTGDHITNGNSLAHRSNFVGGANWAGDSPWVWDQEIGRLRRR
jgi:hypothetical protein